MTFKETLRGLKERCGCVPQRYMLTIMSFLGVVIVYNLRICLNKALEHVAPPQSGCSNQTENSNYLNSDACSIKLHQLSEHTTAQIVSSFYYGYLLAHLPGALLARKLGGKYTFGVAVLLSSIISMLTPPAACCCTVSMIATRVALGTVQGAVFPGLCELMSRWAPRQERNLLATIVFAGSQIGTVFSMSITSWMLEHMHWPQVFYILGSSGVIWFLLWVLLCYSKPSDHPFISRKELEFLASNIPEVHKEMATPWLAMLRSKPVWVLAIAEIGYDYAFFSMISNIPKYYFDFTNFTYPQNGGFSGLPYLMMWSSAVLLAFSCDKIIALKWTTTTQLRRILATIGAVVPCIGIVYGSYVTEPATLVAFVTISMAFMGCYYCSLRVNPLDLSPNHSATIMAISNGAGAISGLISPMVTGAFLANNSQYTCTELLKDRSERRRDWQNVFWITFAVLIISNIPYVLYGSGDVQSWDKPDEVMPVSELRRRSTISGGEPIREKYKNYYPEKSVIKE